MLCRILELCVVMPGLLLGYFPMESFMRLPRCKLFAFVVPLFLTLSCIGGAFCSMRGISVEPVLWVIAAAAVIVYIKTLDVSVWKSGTVALSVCAVFACINSLARAVNAAVLMDMPGKLYTTGFSLEAVVLYNALCWIFAAAAYTPATHSVKKMIEDDNFAQTWYVFWILPLVFTVINLFMIPKYSDTLYTGRVLQGYFVISITLLVMLLWFYAVFLMMANSLNRNARLQQENHLLSMQQQRYENIKNAIEEARQARHDMRHLLNQLSALADEGDIDRLKACLDKAGAAIRGSDLHFCENRAADSVIGYYSSLAKQDGIPFSVQADLPAELQTDETELYIVLANLLENAIEASLRTAASRRYIKLTAYIHAGSLLLIQAENAYDGVIREEGGVFQSSKRKGSGIGLSSVSHIAEKSGGTSAFTYEHGVFIAKIMMHTENSI